MEFLQLMILESQSRIRVSFMAQLIYSRLSRNLCTPNQSNRLFLPSIFKMVSRDNQRLEKTNTESTAFSFLFLFSSIYGLVLIFFVVRLCGESTPLDLNMTDGESVMVVMTWGTCAVCAARNQ
ncbi:hypothetical protein DFH28DRAFT_948709 [Melampsora americana]|nr:hypothetical protein DFH28DRAFT_948709 [Melampsora americana]